MLLRATGIHSTSMEQAPSRSTHLPAHGGHRGISLGLAYELDWRCQRASTVNKLQRLLTATPQRLLLDANSTDNLQDDVTDWTPRFTTTVHNASRSTEPQPAPGRRAAPRQRRLRLSSTAGRGFSTGQLNFHNARLEYAGPFEKVSSCAPIRLDLMRRATCLECSNTAGSVFLGEAADTNCER